MAGEHDSLDSRLQALRQLVDRRLAELAPAGPPSENFHRAIRYSLLAPGKRLRPVLTLLTASCLGANEKDALDPACAIEMIHTASLIIDDLPSMDDAEYRRGQLTNHRVFGEEKTILAGFALVNQAFAVIASAEGLAPEVRLDLVRLAADAIGLNGIISGQERDLRTGEHEQSVEMIQRTYTLKTGALFVAAAEAGARVAGLSGASLQSVRSFGHFLGLAYQTRDDLIDRRASVATAGKDVRIDAHKATLVNLLGDKGATDLGENFVQSAIDVLDVYGDATAELAETVRLLFGQSATGMH